MKGLGAGIQCNRASFIGITGRRHTALKKLDVLLRTMDHAQVQLRNEHDMDVQKSPREVRDAESLSKLATCHDVEVDALQTQRKQLFVFVS